MSNQIISHKLKQRFYLSEKKIQRKSLDKKSIYKEKYMKRSDKIWVYEVLAW